MNVSLEITEAQKLRLQLAQRNCELNIALRCLVGSDIQNYQPGCAVSLPQLCEQLVQLYLEGDRLVREFYQVGEQIRTENGWPDEAQWDGLTLTYSIPAEQILAATSVDWIQ